MRQRQFHTNKREHIHRHPIVAVRDTSLEAGSPSGRLDSWSFCVSSDGDQFGPPTGWLGNFQLWPLASYLIPSDIATMPCPWFFLSSAFLRPLSFGSDIFVKSCVMWPRTALYHETCEDLFRWLILLRARMYIKAELPAVKPVSFCVSAGQHLMKSFCYQKIQNKLFVNLNMAPSWLYNEVWSI